MNRLPWQVEILMDAAIYNEAMAAAAWLNGGWNQSMAAAAWCESSRLDKPDWSGGLDWCFQIWTWNPNLQGDSSVMFLLFCGVCVCACAHGIRHAVFVHPDELGSRLSVLSIRSPRPEVE